MAQIENMQIQAEGKENVHFLVAAATLGMLDMIEKEIISSSDAAMAFNLPIMIRIEENTLMHEICSLVDELDTYPPMRRQGEIEKIRKLCFELAADYSRIENVRKDQTISFEIQHSDLGI
ncbi:MAG: hypothetical protein IJY39_09015 [Clostridia bacterium]|nr:hypothetical protein [Clostridia bacterium]